jgi:hypothetical protein
MRRWIEVAAGPPPLPEQRVATFMWGLAQPLLGLQMLRRHPDLLRPAILPVVLVAGFCVLSAFGGHETSVGGVVFRFYAALAGAASAPPFLFANTYARVAARAHERLGLGPAAPHRTRFWSRVWQLVRFALVIAVPIAPVLGIVGAVPLFGAAVAFALSALWTLHWIVVEALDGARVAGEPGDTPPEWPWFVAWAGRPGFARIPAPVRWPLGWSARRVRALTRPWHEEAALVAQHPVLSAGFGLTVAGLLAVPIVNLLVRPALLVGGVHVLARVRATDRNAAVLAAGAQAASQR